MAENIPDEKKTSAELKHDFEINQYIQALGASSSRVRFVMLAIIITSIASVATWWSERDGAWERARLLRLDNHYAHAAECDYWNNRDFYEKLCSKKHSVLTAPEAYKKNPKTCGQICGTVSSLKHYGISGSKEFSQAFAQKEQEAFINNVLYVRTPVLGITFDINNLGLISGLTFFILMLVMLFYVHRAHENLSLCMWKVRHIAESDHCFDQPGSRANLLYHALAMQQVFTVPPTLARWRDIGAFRRAHYLLFFLPIIVQFIVLRNDYSTRALGSSYNIHETNVSMWGQRIFFLLIIPFTISCCAHLYADDRLWVKSFYTINPAHRFKEKARWLHWVKIIDNNAPGWGIQVHNNNLVFCDSVFGSIWEFPINFSKEKEAWEQLSEKRRTRSKGIYYSPDGQLHDYYLGSDDYLAEVDWGHGDKTQRFSYDGWERLPFFDGSRNELQVFAKKKLRISAEGKATVEIGGAENQRDGREKEVGFDIIRAILVVNDLLFLTDGAWVRKIEPDGSVDTWGGKPLGKAVRRDRPFVLGLDVENKPQSSLPAGSPPSAVLLVCDFSRGRILRVSNANDEPTVVPYHVKDGWSPSGIFIHGSNTYILEYKQTTRRGEIATFIQRRRIRPLIIRPLVWLLWRRSYLRIMKVEKGKFQEAKEIVKISLSTAQKAQKAVDRPSNQPPVAPETA